MRLPTELWVKAYLRTVTSAGLFATVARHGDDDLGTVWIKVNRLDGSAVLLGPAPEAYGEVRDDRRWLAMHKTETITEADAEQMISRAHAVDSDLWVIEVEDRAGRHFLDDSIMTL